MWQLAVEQYGNLIKNGWVIFNEKAKSKVF